MDRSVEVVVAGATGLVGRELLNALADTGHPSERITLLASDRSEGQELDYLGDTLQVEKATPEALRGRRLVLMSMPPEPAKTFGLAAQAAGAWVVDVSRAFAPEVAVPVVLPAVNAARVHQPFPGRIVRCPSAIASAFVTMLEPIRQQVGLRQVSVTALMGASASGVRGVQSLEAQTAGLLSGKELEDGPFPHRLAFNLIPQVGAFRGAQTDEELGWQEDARQIWGETSALHGLGGMAIQVPHFFGHALSVTFQTEREINEDGIRALWRSHASVKLLDVPAERIYPMPSIATADPAVLVGRLQTLPNAPFSFMAFAVIDNAGRGAALNALEVGERLVSQA
jgi:aspartate-semialdehyde dehydrogenase